MASKVTGFYVFSSNDKTNVYTSANRSALLGANVRSWRDANLFAGAPARYYGVRSMYADGTYVDSPVRTIRLPAYLGYGNKEIICGDFEWGHFQTAKSGEVSLLDGTTVLSNRNPQIKVAFEGRVMIIDTEPAIRFTGQSGATALTLLQAQGHNTKVVHGEYIYERRISQKQDIASVLSLRLAGMGIKHDVYPLICPWPAPTDAYQTNITMRQLIWGLTEDLRSVCSWYDVHAAEPQFSTGTAGGCWGVALAVYELIGKA